MRIYLITKNAQPTKEQLDKLKELGDFKWIDAIKLSAQDVIDKAGDAEILILGSSGVDKISEELISGLKNLKFVSLLTVGTNWVDLEAARKHNIQISNIKGANSEAVAEHTWAMILNLAKRVTEFERDVREKGAFNFGPYRGKEVFGKTLGIIGLGDIGKKVARIAQGFNMEIIGVNVRGKKVEGIELVDLDTLLKKSDVITICAPLTKDTENMITEKEIEKMKEGVILVNCARHQITNKEAVIKGVQSKKLFGFGIETEIMQPVDKNDEYLKYSNIIITPHNAFNTEDAEIKSFDTVISNIEGFLAGKLENLVT